MKIFKQVLSFLLVVLSIEFTFSQAVFTDLNFSHSNSHRSQWDLYEVGGTLSDNVATIRKQGSSQIERFGSRIRSFGSAVIRFNTCLAVGKTFKIQWNTYNWAGTNVGNDTFMVTVLPPPIGQLTPTFAFSSINGSCNQVTLCVTNPLPDATYAWNGTIPGACATFNAPAPAQIQAVATCGIGTGSVGPSTQVPPGPPFPPGVSFNEGTFATICEGQQLSLNATSKTCINSPNNWVWSSSGGSISNESVSSGSTADAVFTASSSGSYVVTIQVTDIFGNVSTDNINIQVLSQSDPQCNIFFLKQSTDKPQVSADKAKKMEDINSNTDGSNGSTKIDVDNKSGIKKGIYPNPANEVLNVGNIQGVQSIEVVDLNGKVIKTVSVGENEISRALNVSDLSGGIYILKKIKRDGQLEATKFQVIH